MPTDTKSEIVIFKTADEKISVDVRFEGETVWLTQAQLVDLYGSSKANVSEHIKHIFEEEELEEDSVVRNFRTTAADGKSYQTKYYNLDMIISLGYRIKSKIATQFRQWATKRLNEYIRKGFTMDDERLKEAGGGDYWKELLARIRAVLDKARSCLAERSFNLQALINAKDFNKTALLLDACDAVCESIEKKKAFTTMASELIRLFKYTDRDDLSGDEKKQYDAIAAIYAMLQKKRKHVDTTDLMVEINGIINDYVQIEPAEQGITPSRQFDISGIDFDLLRREFAKAKRKNLVIRDLELVIQERIAALLFNNPNRINYYEQYQKIIEAYNQEQDRSAIEKTFMDLMNLAHNMTQEQQRYVREGFTSDEELSLYDMLFRDDLSKSDIKKIKEVAVSLLAKVKEKISQLDHWTDKQETKAVVDTLIRDTLWNELPECYDDLSISRYRQQIYEYVYTRYPDVA